MYYVVRNCLGDETIIYPWKNGFMFVKPEQDYLPKPQSKTKTIEYKWFKDDEKVHANFTWSVLHDPNYEGWHLKDDGYWWERREIKPKAFKTTVNVSVVKFDNISLKDAIGSCFCEMDAYIDTYPEAFIIDKGAETSLNMGVCKCH